MGGILQLQLRKLQLERNGNVLCEVHNESVEVQENKQGNINAGTQILEHPASLTSSKHKASFSLIAWLSANS